MKTEYSIVFYPYQYDYNKSGRKITNVPGVQR